MSDTERTDAGDELVSEETREVEQEEAHQPHRPGDDPTASEEHAAERTGEVDDEVRERYRDMTRTGAEISGEGEIE